MSQQTRSRHGIALLLVLATLVLAVTAAAGLARVATAARLHAESARRAAAADALLDAAEAPILDWLHRHAGRTVLPPEVASPRVAVLDDAIGFAGQRCRVTITAFDQCGMAPPSWGASGGGAMLPADILDALDRAGEAFTEHPGLDLLAGARPTYPAAEESPVPAVGEVLATHNPPRPGRPPAVNINTAPIPLLEAVYAARGLGGLEAVLDARAAGRVASPGALKAPHDDPRTDIGIPLPVAMSGAWAFRIDCYASGLRRSWWCVYADTGSNWERVQRLAIDE
ncbi:MAG: type II secretion system protein GspK [Phycisphaerales bacterium JB054]